MSIKHVEFDNYGYLDGASLTGSFVDLLTVSDDADVLLVFNSCSEAIVLKVPSKLSTKEIRLPARASFVLDGRTNSKRLAKGVIQVKHAGVVPTAGEVCVSVVR